MGSAAEAQAVASEPGEDPHRPTGSDCDCDDAHHHNTSNRTVLFTLLYLITGCLQPIWMTLLWNRGLADASCQLYMLFYYLGTASAVWLVRDTPWPSSKTILKTSAIALLDVGGQTLNYTGAGWTGPTIFAIVYSSVTIWAALYSQALLGRKMVPSQWMAVFAVLGGLGLTATDSMELGVGVAHGVLLVMVGSSMRGLFYVLSESLMTTGEERLTAYQNCAIQGIAALVCFGIWQVHYTIPHWGTSVREPMQVAGTSLLQGLAFLLVFALLSFVHSITLYHILSHLPGGSTSAGVFKGLQAVLVFGLTQLVYCGRIGGAEMCFSSSKFLSLLTVTAGVLWYGYATSQASGDKGKRDNSNYNAIRGGADVEHDSAPELVV